MNPEKVSKFIEALGIDAAIFAEEHEGDPAEAIKEYNARVTEAVRKDADFLREVEKANFGKFNGSAISKLKKQFGFTESEVKEKTYEEVLAMGTEKLKADLGKGQEELLAKLQLLPQLEEEKADLLAKLETLPDKIRKEYDHTQRLDRAITEAFASVKGLPFDLGEFSLLAKARVLDGDFSFDESGALRKVKGTGFELDEKYKPVDYAAKLREFAAKYVPAQNPAPPTNGYRPSGTAQATPADKILADLMESGFVPPVRK